MRDGEDHDRILISKTDKRAKSPRRIQMRKIAFLASLLALVAIMAAPAMADTFLLPAGAKLKAVVEQKSGGLWWATISWEGFQPDELEHYRATPTDQKGNKVGWKSLINIEDKTSVEICVSEGNTFQFKKEGKWALITSEGFQNPFSPVTLTGIGVDCSNSGGCKFAVLKK